MKTAHLEVDVQSDACPTDSPGGMQNEEGEENRTSDAGIKSKLVTWFTLAAFVVAAVAVTALAGSSVPSNLLREHTGSESEGRKLRRRYTKMSIWMDNINNAEEWGVSLYMNDRRDDVILFNYQTRYVSKPVSRQGKRLLTFQVMDLPEAKGKTKLLNFDMESDNDAVTYEANVGQYGAAERYLNFYISTYFGEYGPYCNGAYSCNCSSNGRSGSKYVWKCELDFENRFNTIPLKIRAV